MIRRIVIALAMTAGLAGFAASPAFAAGPPTGAQTDNGNVAVTGTISQVCGFDGSLPASLNLGVMAPGVASTPVALSYHVKCNDSNGYLTAALAQGAATLTGGSGNQLAGDNPQPCPTPGPCSGAPSTWSGDPIFNVTAGLGINGTPPSLQTSPWGFMQTYAPINGIPFALLDGATTAPSGGSVSISDMWSATLPTSVFFPGVLSASIGMFTFAQ